MARLLVIYDPTGHLDLNMPPGVTIPADQRPSKAVLDVVNGLSPEAIVNLARTLAELLLEQMA